MDTNTGSHDTPVFWNNNRDLLQRILPELLARKLGIVPLAISNDELWIGTFKVLSTVDRTTLGQGIRYPIRFFLMGYTQVTHLQSRLYSQNDTQPPSPALDTLFEVLGMEKGTRIKRVENIGAQPLAEDISKWLQDDLITPSQWAQLMSMVHYSPNKITHSALIYQ